MLHAPLLSRLSAGAYGIEQRLALLREHKASLHRVEGTNVDGLIAKWREALANDADLWQAKLTELGLSEEDFRNVIGLEADGLLAIDLPKPCADNDSEDGLFDGLTEPFLNRLTEGIWKSLSPAQSALAKPLITFFRDHIKERLRFLAERCVVLELHIDRVTGAPSEQATEDRLRVFASKLKSAKGYQNFFETYPVLGPAFCEIISGGINNFIDFIEKLNADRAVIAEAFFDGLDPYPPSAAQFGLGDCHKNGLAVAQVDFPSGKSIMYKPRSVAVDKHLQAFQSWVNQQAPGLNLRLPKIIGGKDGTYGWMEFVSPAPCATRQDVERFYFRQGAHLAIFHALGATDLHRENLVASGDQPVVFDVEALMQPKLSAPATEREELCLEMAVADSVVATGFLPSPFGQHETVDLSGLAGRNSQRTPYKVLQWQDQGTDQWRYVRRATTLLRSDHIARDSQGRETSALSHMAAIQRGYCVAYTAISKGKKILLRSGGMIDRFANDEIRVVARSTSSYGVLLQESTHPDIAQDALARDRLFDELWLPTRRQPVFQKLIRSEQRDLCRFDIPIFTSRPGITSLFDSEGREIPAVLRETGLSVAKRRINNNNQHELEKQRWLIEATLKLQATNEGQQAVTKNSVIGNSGSPEGALAAAVDIGDRLVALLQRSLLFLAFRGAGRCSPLENCPHWSRSLFRLAGNSSVFSRAGRLFQPAQVYEFGERSDRNSAGRNHYQPTEWYWFFHRLGWCGLCIEPLG